jgi:predicted DNA binding protein/DNA-binding NarL/FixJ family response regulator
MNLETDYVWEPTVPGVTEVLLVDDDPQWARATAQLLEAAEPALAVTVANSLAEGRELVNDEVWECVICDYHLGDGTGLDLLTTVTDADGECPFLLVTGKGDEIVASEAIRSGVTDYIVKSHDDAEAAVLANRVINAIVSARRREQLRREHQGMVSALNVLQSARPESGFLKQFCQIVVKDHDYAGAWIGAIEAGPETVIIPQTAEGCEDYLDVLAEQGQVHPDSPDPVVRAVEHDQPVVVSVRDTATRTGSFNKYHTSAADWADLARDHGFTAAVALPMQHDSVRVGVLCVYLSTDSRPLTSRRWTVLCQYADLIGRVHQNAELRRSLLADPVITFDIEIADEAAPLAELTARLDSSSTLRVLSMDQHDDGTVRYLSSVSNTSVEQLQTAAIACDTLEVSSITETETGIRCDVYSCVFSPTGIMVAHGARVEEISASDGRVTATLAVTDHSVVSSTTSALREEFDMVTVTMLWNDHISIRSRRESPLESLTDKQQTVLREAYFRGYFERPRDINATELADSLDIARATMTQHLRAAEAKVFSELFDPSVTHD